MNFLMFIVALFVTWFTGNMELLVYKAASACHLYGPEFTYVVKACTYLKKEKNGEMSILKMHMENAIGFYTK